MLSVHPPHEQKSPLWAVKSLPASCRLSVLVSQSFFNYTFFALSSSCQHPCYIPVFSILLYRSHLLSPLWFKKKKWQNGLLPPSCVCVSSLKQHGSVQTLLAWQAWAVRGTQSTSTYLLFFFLIYIKVTEPSPVISRSGGVQHRTKWEICKCVRSCFAKWFICAVGFSHGTQDLGVLRSISDRTIYVTISECIRKSSPWKIQNIFPSQPPSKRCAVLHSALLYGSFWFWLSCIICIAKQLT